MTPKDVVDLMEKMGVPDTVVSEEGEITCHLPITRTDILAGCDIAEDLCIAKGFNNIEFKLPPSFTMGGETLLNKMTDLIR